MTEPTFRWENPGLGLAIYEDRLEILIKKRLQVIPLTAISAVSVGAHPKRLVIRTAEGKQIQMLMGPFSEHARAMIAHKLQARAGSREVGIPGAAQTASVQPPDDGER